MGKPLPNANFLLPLELATDMVIPRFQLSPMYIERDSSEKLFSTYRAALMGLAMLCIMLHHFGKLGVMHCFLAPFDFAGPVGVEIFFFLSGLGCYYSWQKRGTWVFYKRRFLRILPVAFLAGLCKLCILQPTWQLSDLRYLFGINLWFIEAYFVYILFVPVLMHILLVRRRIGLPILLLLAILMVFSNNIALHILPMGWVGRFHEMLTQAPAFILGTVWAYLYNRKYDILSKMAWPLQLVLVATAVGAYFYVVEGAPQFHQGPFNIIVILAVMSPFLIYLLVYFFVVLSLFRLFIPIQTGLAWMGTLSLELYLVHEFIFEQFSTSVLAHWSPLWGLLILFGISFLSAWLLHVCARKSVQIVAKFASHETKQA